MSNTSYQEFDDLLRANLERDCDQNLAKKLYSSYVQTKERLEVHVLEHISGSEPSLTDHGPRHIDNVLRNAIRLLPKRDGLPDISGREHYCLGMSILFHDAGNIYVREGHRDHIARLHDKIRGTHPSLRRERTLIARAARAHTGRAQDGSTDTLKEVDDGEHLYEGQVRLREVAAVLRLADELAEGPHRTSEFMRSEGLYDSKSMKYHEYASSTHVYIDRSSGRLALTYEIDLTAQDRAGDLGDDVLKGRLEYVYARIQKLNQERQYARFYSRLLRDFTSTEASFNFHHFDEVLNLDLKPLTLTDIVLPGDQARSIDEINRDYALDGLVPRVLRAIEEVTLSGVSAARGVDDGRVES